MNSPDGNNAPNIISTYLYHSPVTEILLGSFGNELCLCDWQHSARRERTDRKLQTALDACFEYGITPVIARTIEELDEYFAGRRRTFDIPLLMTGTPFQQCVWNALRNIPYGITVSYARIAEQIGKPQHVRAVANANGANPISILIPCHRVIGSDSRLTGYGGGLHVKKYLLELESHSLFK